MSHANNLPTTRYTPHLLYRVLAGIGAVVVVLLSIQAWRTPEPAGWFFPVLGVAVLLHFLRLAATRVTLDTHGIRVERPGAQPRTLAYRQLADIHEEGRGLRSLLLLYHPRRADGMIEPDELRSLALPALADQAALMQQLTDRMSR